MTPARKLLHAVSAAIIAAVFFSGISVLAGKEKKNSSGEDGLRLTAQWKEYEKASLKDLPQKQAAVLQEIISESEAKGYSWDLYEALVEYYTVTVRRNWKETGNVASEIRKTAGKYSSPVVSYNLAVNGIAAVDFPNIDSLHHAPVLTGKRSKQFYGNDVYLNSGFPAAIPGFIRERISNDYEYLLWSILKMSYSRDVGQIWPDIRTAAKNYFGETYPEAACIEFMEVAAGESEQELRDYASKYAGSSARMFAEAKLLENEYDSLTNARASSAAFSALREKCSAFEKDRKSLSGNEKRLTEDLTSVQALAERLDAERIRAEMAYDTLYVYLKNIQKVKVRIFAQGSNGEKAGNPVFETDAANRKCSYHVEDTVAVALPPMNDGKYHVSCSGSGLEISFDAGRYSISAAVQYSADKPAFYVADFRTGRPVTCADVFVGSKGTTVWKAKDVSFNGFTVLGDGFSEKVSENSSYSFICTYRDSAGLLRCSLPLYFNPVSGVTEEANEEADNLDCCILKDRAAFNPGDTLKYKIIAFYPGKNPVCAESHTLVVQMYDADNGLAAADTLITNEFGSAAGEFALPVGRKNGSFRLCVMYGKEIAGSSGFTVDEFKLPAFTLDFNPLTECYFPGDTVEITGKIESYSGRSLSSAKTTYSVSEYRSEHESGTLQVSPDGTFSLKFTAGRKTDSFITRSVKIRISDATGETLEFSENYSFASFFVDINLKNAAAGSAALPVSGLSDSERCIIYPLEGDTAAVSFAVSNSDFTKIDTEVSYRLSHEGKEIHSGKYVSGKELLLDLSGHPSGKYRLEASAEIKGRIRTDACELVKTADDDTSLPVRLENFFKVVPSGKIRMQFGASDGPVWAIIRLLGDGKSILLSDSVFLTGGMGEEGSLKMLEYDFPENCGDAVRLSVFYFRNGSAYSFEHDYEIPRETVALPLAFSRFTDKAIPGEKCEYEIQTSPDVECAVSVFDKSTETVRRNEWTLPVLQERRLPVFARTSYSAGNVYGQGGSAYDAYGRTANGIMFERMTSTRAGMPLYADEEDAYIVTKNTAAAAESDVEIRSDFSDVLAFYPFLRSGSDGKIKFSVPAGDKLSTFHVSVFGHDRRMNCNSTRNELLVSLPVSISAAAPSYLYENDLYRLKISLSNTSGSEAQGMLSMSLFDGKDYETQMPVLTTERHVRTAGGESSAESFDINVPEGIDTLGIKVIFAADQGYSDGIFIYVPVEKPEQELVESHSSVLRRGMDRDSLYSVLMSSFVNVSGYGASVHEISLAGLLKNAVPEISDSEVSDAVSASALLLSSCLSDRLRGSVPDTGRYGELLEQILDYQNADGGFSWLKGGKSSPVITAVILERFALIAGTEISAGAVPGPETISRAVSYLDAGMISGGRIAEWCGGISLGQYLYVRSLYRDFAVTSGTSKKELKSFAREIRNSLLPAKRMEAEGSILYKARRAATLLNFISPEIQEDKCAYLESVNMKLGRKGRSRLSGYVNSLKEYAVAHVSGGMYYPNAVMPFRGLLENELYAHSMICGLLSRYGDCASDTESVSIADGIRLWIMVQKETQQWSSDPSYLLAVNSVSEGSDELMETVIAVMSMKYRKPFNEIKAASNGISIKCRYFREGGNDSEFDGYSEIMPGDTVYAGDRIMAVYDLWSEENRSFVLLETPRYPCLRPERQLSGFYGLSFRPLSVPGYGTIMPFCYREVKKDRCNWYFDVFPEGKARIADYMFVTQAGEFTCPAAEIESLYAPHYRGNDNFSGKFLAE